MLKLKAKRAKILWAKFKKLSFRKKLVVLAVLAIAVILAGYQSYRASKTSDYDLEVAIISSITEVVGETGNVTTTGSIPIYSTTTGIVEEVYVSNGDHVEKDQILFKVISTATKQEKNAALSTYLAAKTAWETSKATQYSLQANMFTQWDQFKELAESDSYEEDDGRPKYEQRNLPEFHTPEKEWLAAEALYKKQQVAISQAAASMSSTWQAYQATQDSEVEAILDGEIRNLGVAKGDLVSVYSVLTLTTNAPALIIFNTDVRTIIKTDVGETDVIKIEEGQLVQIEFDALSDQMFSGQVGRVDSIAVPTSGVVKYSVYIFLDEEIDSVRGGMTADVDIEVATKENILTVSSSAVKPYEGGRAVRIVGNNNEIEYVSVKIGLKGGGKTEILSGISEGTEVIMALKNEQVKRTGGLF